MLTTTLALLLILSFGCEKEDDSDSSTALPKVSINSVSKPEGNTGTTVFQFEVQLTGKHKKPVTVSYITQNGSAFSGVDYEAAAGTLSFSASETSKTININVLTDNVKEGDEEFFVKLTSTDNAELHSTIGTATITNDDTTLDISEDGYTSTDSYAGWKLVWQDEFEGKAVNTDDWTFEFGDHGWGNNELQYYTDRPENVRVENGKLIIEARKDNWEGHTYTSTRMKTQDKQIFQYGRIDIRAKVPKGQGIWPALWMLGNDISTVNWPACGEIDIMELVGHEPSTTHGTAHWGRDGANHKYKGSNFSIAPAEFADAFHVFSIAWYQDVIYWFVDDIQFYKISSKDMNGQPYPFNDKFFFLFNVAVGGNWPGYPDETTVFPQQMEVDYVRVFQEE